MKLTKEEEKRVVDSIQKAEAQTSGEIRVHLKKNIKKSVYEEACETFESLGMTKTTERNGILIFLVTSQKQFSIVGDVGIHQKVGESFWNHIRDAMQDHFKKGDFAQGLVHGVQKCGEELAKFFPHQENDRNELPDQVTRS
ncbi:MAG: TPM domain-containing protein [Deltaproteobacteria bacterium]|nr:MAG: TPM domain-containing protein [Deltaproteobacteria bacterium]